jgi:hypothetical protein
MVSLLNSGALKYEIFRLLRAAGEPLSDEQLAGRIGVARAAVQSCLNNELRPTGYVKEDNERRWSILSTGDGGADPMDDPLQIAYARIKELEAQITAMEGEVEMARVQVKGTRKQDKEAVLYASVGLAPDCEDHVYKAARRAIRRNLHPDKFPAEEKEAAHKRFVALEEVFAKIEKLRK